MKSLLNILKKPDMIVAVLSLSFGLIFIAIIRPLNTPDEAHHFIRAYEISEGKVFLTSSDGGSCVADGSTLRSEEEVFSATIPKSIAEFTAIDRNIYKISDEMKRPLNAKEKIQVCGDQTSANSPIGYLPQALAIALLRPFNAPPILMDYAARIAILLAWTVCIAAAVRIIPVRKWAIVGVALLPIAIQQSMAIGTDALSIAPGVLFLAYIVRSYYEDRRRHLKADFGMITALIAIATLSKPIMILLVLIVPFYYIVPDKKQTTFYRKLKAIGMFAPLIMWLIWSVFAAKNHVSTTDVFEPARMHIDAFKDAPFNEVAVFVEYTVKYILYDLSLWGYGSFKWFTATMPYGVTTIGLIILALILLVGYPERRMPLKKITNKQVLRYNIITVIVAMGLLLANIFTLYMIYTKPGEWMVRGIQFRYFLIIFFTLACVIEARFLRASEAWYRNLVLISSVGLFLVSVATITGLLPSI